MDMNAIQIFVTAALEIFRRHLDGGTPVTNEQVWAELQAKISSGQHAIAVWYAEHGLELPK